MLALLAIIGFFMTTTAAQEAWRDKVDAGLLLQMRTDETPSFVVLFEEKADLSGAAAIKGRAAKSAYVFQQLTSVAQRSQAGVIQYLNALGAPYQSLYIVNALETSGDASLIEQLAERPDVKRLMYNPVVSQTLPELDRSVVSRDPQEVSWPITKIGVESVWAMGYTGRGVVVGGQDTGYEWDHPALKDKYRGWNGVTADHNYNWHDAIHSYNPMHTNQNNPCGLDSKTPCDDHNHGTLTMGIAVGAAPDNTIGIAPGAQWMGCRNMDRGYGAPGTYLECFQWFLAPTDLNNQNPDPSKGPDVIVNSWGCPSEEGCNAPNWSVLDEAINALRAAGVVIVASAGNDGSACSTVADPPAMFDGSFSVGATQQSDTIAGFSSRGPVLADGSRRLKPDIVAPGVGIRSSIRNQQYGSASGTSLSGPVVAGVVALVLSAHPELSGDVDAIEALLERTAQPITGKQVCGDLDPSAVPNPTYGYGRVNALEAVLGFASGVDQPALSGVSVFPNPSTGKVNIGLPQDLRQVQVELWSVTGQQLLIRRIQDGQTQVELDLSTLPAGWYAYRITAKEGVYSGRLVLQSNRE